MEHIKQYDWCSSEPDKYFINEADVDNSVTERILRNKFHDPLISSDSEDESKPKEKINWDEIFKKKTNDKNPRVLVPGFHNAPPFQKLSALTAHQHIQCLKVLCASKPDILPAQFIGRPTKQDHRVFEEVKEAYAKEQQEFIDWAKSLWASSHCVRALRPKPAIEMVYEAEFRVTAHKMQSFPKNYAVAAQIPLEIENVLCEMVEEKDLINVNISTLPKIKVPDMLSKVFIMNNTYPVPEPCNKHPCRFKLPNESTMTVLPLTEVHRELAQYAADHGAGNIASEQALRCLVELDRSWLLAVSVCQVLTQDEPTNVVVLDCDFAVSRESALVRTHKALRRLLAHALVPPNLTAEKRSRSDNRSTPKRSKASDHEQEFSDDDDNLYIDTDYGHDLNETKEKEEEPKTETANKTLSRERRDSLRGGSNKLEFYNCTCRDSFDKPAPRSFRKWKVINKTSSDRVNLIVHCPHTTKGDSGEVVLEPIPEYQTDLGGSAQSPHTIRSLALAMLLRKNASVLNVRIDGPTGEIVTLEPVSKEDLVKQHSDIMSEVSNKMYATFDQLQGLLPGHYVLQHEPSHGANAILCRAQCSGEALRLQFECAQLAEGDEARSLKAPPALTPVLLPIHKYRRYLPCAFPPFQNLVARPPRRAPPAPPPRKAPPQAIKWPKKKRGRKKNNNNDNN